MLMIYVTSRNNRHPEQQPRPQGHFRFQNGGRNFESGDGPGDEVSRTAQNIDIVRT